MRIFLKSRYLFIKLTLLTFLVFIQLLKYDAAFSETNTKVSVRGTGYSIPRFVSIKNDEAWMRKGPSKDYPIDWVYKVSGLPLKIVAEFDDWRKVIDASGTIGWMHTINLSSKRTVQIIGSATKLFEERNLNSKIVAQAEKDSILSLVRCKDNWCRLKHKNISGWITKDRFYGIVENEKFE